jgi:hypothetical protein
VSEQLAAGSLRMLNEGIASVAVVTDERLSELNVWEFRCECGRSDCAAWVELDIREYEAIRATDEPILANAHETHAPAQARARAARLSEEAKALRAQARQQTRRTRRLRHSSTQSTNDPGV